MSEVSFNIFVVLLGVLFTSALGPSNWVKNPQKKRLNSRDRCFECSWMPNGRVHVKRTWTTTYGKKSTDPNLSRKV